MNHMNSLRQRPTVCKSLCVKYRNKEGRERQPSLCDNSFYLLPKHKAETLWILEFLSLKIIGIFQRWDQSLGMEFIYILYVCYRHSLNVILYNIFVCLCFHWPVIWSVKISPYDIMQMLSFGFCHLGKNGLFANGYGESNNDRTCGQELGGLSDILNCSWKWKGWQVQSVSNMTS